jgi:uncharacterized membrane protein
MAKFCTQCGEPVSPDMNFCSNCGEQLEEYNAKELIRFQDKRERVLKQKRTNNHLKKLLIVGSIPVLIFGGFAFMKSLPATANPIIENQPVVSAQFNYPNYPTKMQPIQVNSENGKIIVPLELVKEKKFVVFNYNSANGSLPLLAYVSGEGKIVTAVSVCEPCNSNQFHIRSDEIVCNSCGTTWQLNNLHGISGACQKYPPDPLPSVVVGDQIQIDEAVVAAWVPRI